MAGLARLLVKSMRIITVCFAVLLLAIQYPLWLGKGGWLRVWDMERQVSQAKAHNQQLKQRNDKLDSEVQNLKEGTDSVEERARFELGMIKKDEIFVQILSPDSPLPVTAAPPANPKAPAR